LIFKTVIAQSLSPFSSVQKSS